MIYIHTLYLLTKYALSLIVPNKRKVVFANGEIYHVFNQSVGNLEIFTRNTELMRILDLISYYRFPQTIRYSQYKKLSKDAKEKYRTDFEKLTPLIEIYAFSLMPDHYHLLLRQIIDDGIKTFTSNFQNAYAKYFNTKKTRSGSVFSNPFKAKWIENDEIFLHVSRYIHLNPVTSYIIKIDELSNYPWTSYSDYVSGKTTSLINTKLLIGIAGSIRKYQEFVKNQVDYQRKLQNIKKAVFD